jgi:hypothetical protein
MPNGSRHSGAETATPKHSKHPHAASGANAKHADVPHGAKPKRAGAPHSAAAGKGRSDKPMKFRTQHTGLKGVRLPRSK